MGVVAALSHEVARFLDGYRSHGLGGGGLAGRGAGVYGTAS